MTLVVKGFLFVRLIPCLRPPANRDFWIPLRLTDLRFPRLRLHVRLELQSLLPSDRLAAHPTHLCREKRETPRPISPTAAISRSKLKTCCWREVRKNYASSGGEQIHPRNRLIHKYIYIYMCIYICEYIYVNIYIYMYIFEHFRSIITGFLGPMAQRRAS